MPLANYVANRLFAVTGWLLVGVKSTDLHSGMRAYSRRLIREVDFDPNGPALPVELLLKPALQGFHLREVFIPYGERIGETTLQRWSSTVWTFRRIFHLAISRFFATNEECPFCRSEITRSWCALTSLTGLQEALKQPDVPATGFAAAFIAESIAILESVDIAAVERMANGLARVRELGGRLFILGVGGSAGHASHAVNDFRKLCGFEAYAPTDNVSELTARANDEGWDTCFAGVAGGLAHRPARRRAGLLRWWRKPREKCIREYRPRA